MKTLVLKRQSQRGSVLVTALVLSCILGMTLAGYLYWVRTQNVLVAQSQAWNAALVYAEAGVEEAMAQINVNFSTNYLSSAQANWGGGYTSGYFGPRTNVFTDGSYSAIIQPVVGAPGPTIISTGYAVVPLIGKPVLRVVEVTTESTSCFGNAITVRSNLTLKGTRLMVDSFDSADPAHSTNGMYDLATRKDNGDVNSLGGIIDVGNAEIYGHLRTGPEGTYTLGNGSVGDLSWNVKGALQPGHYADDFNMEMKEVFPPYSSGASVVGIDLKTNVVYELGSNDYFQNGDFVMSQNETMVVNGNATFYVTGTFNMKSQNACTIVIMPNASLKLYVGTRDGSPTAAYLTQVNTAGNAYTFQFYGLNSTKVMTWVGNNTYVGTVYAPEAAVTMGGGGDTVMDFQGACVAKSGVLNGHFNVHYDENLRRITLPTGFTVASWREL